MLLKVQNWGSVSQIESALIECFGRFSLFQAQFVRESQLQLPPALLLISLSLSLNLCLVVSFSPYAIQLLQIVPSQLTTSHDDDDDDDGALFSPCIKNSFNSRRSADQAFPHIHRGISVSLPLLAPLSEANDSWKTKTLGLLQRWFWFWFWVRAMHTWLVLDKFIIE